MCKSCAGSEPLVASTNQILPENCQLTAHFGMQGGSSTKTWNLNGMTLLYYLSHGQSQLETQGVAFSRSYLPLNSYCSAFIFLAASGTYCGHLTSLHYLFLNEISLFKSQCDSVKSKSQLSKKDYLSPSISIN